MCKITLKIFKIGNDYISVARTLSDYELTPFHTPVFPLIVASGAQTNFPIFDEPLQFKISKWQILVNILEENTV